MWWSPLRSLLRALVALKKADLAKSACCFKRLGGMKTRSE